MSILRAYAVPHPPLAVPGVGRGMEDGIRKTLSALDEIAGEVAALCPETIIFITSHNVVYSDYFHISPGRSANGDFSHFGDSTARFETQYDIELAEEIERFAGQAGIRAGTLGERDAKLDHGVMVPMWFIDRRYHRYKTVRVSQSGMGAAEHYRFGRCIARAAEISGRKTVLVASGDLSHKLTADGPYGFAPEGAVFDNIVTEAFSSGDFFPLFSVSEDLRGRAAECVYGSFLILAGCLDRRRVDARLLSYEGPYGVGYAVASFSPGGDDAGRDFLEQFDKIALAEAHRRRDSEDHYRALARKSLEYTVMHGGTLPLPDGLPNELLNSRAGAFVSLHKNGELRGCIGTIGPTARSIAHEVIQNAVSAGLSDNRFEPVGVSELPYLTYKVDILSAPEEISSPDELDVKRYGVIVTSGYKRGLLLPNLDGIDTVDEQIAIARKKAGIPENAPVKLERFEVVRHE